MENSVDPDQLKTADKNLHCFLEVQMKKTWFTVLSVMSDSDVMFCLQSYQGLRIDRSLVY